MEISNEGTSADQGHYWCGACGHMYYFHLPDNNYPNSYYHTVTSTSYTCGSYTNTWKLGCELSTSSIEEAIIKYVEEIKYQSVNAIDIVIGTFKAIM